MPSTLALLNGFVTTPDRSELADVLIEDGRIAQVGGDVPATGLTLDVRGCHVLPGGVDVHTHLDTPFMGTVTADDYSDGTIAAACGGTTTIVDYAMQQADEKLPETIESWHQKAAGKAAIDFSFHLAVRELYPSALTDLRMIADQGVTSFKVFMAYRGALMLNDGQLFEVLRTGAAHGATVCVHAENGDVIDVLARDLANSGKLGPASHQLSRPPATEVEAVRRAIAISDMAGAPLYLVHLSTAGAVEAVQEARDAGMPVSGETCPHYLLLDESLYLESGFNAAQYVVTPPLRGQSHRDALWRGLAAGSLSVVSSDHCPFCLRGQKDLGRDDFRLIPNGGPGVEDRFIALYGQGVRRDRISMQRFVDLVATSPAQTFGLYPRKGTIAPGSDADVTVLDPEGTTVTLAATQKSRSDYSMFEGWHFPGRIRHVFSRGTEIVRNGRYIGKPGHGRFIERDSVA